MIMAKPHLEFVTVNMEEGWESPPGYPEGIKQKVLASDMDEEKKTTPHGPFKSETGCLLFELHYY
jgi:hypothetical protein